MPQHAEQSSHLDEALAPDPLDPLDRHASSLRGAEREHLVGGLGLDDDHAHCVCDGIVELARDPRTFVRGCGPDTLLAVLLRVLGTLAQLRHVQASRAEIDAQ